MAKSIFVRGGFVGSSGQFKTVGASLLATWCISSDSTGTEACGYTEMITVGTGVPACPLWSAAPIHNFLG